MTNAERIAKRAKRGRALLIGAVAAACGFGLYAIVVNVQQGADITKIESPCVKYGAKSEQCKEAFEQAVLTITHPQACAILRTAGLEIQPCAHARLRQEHRRGRERAATASKESGGAGALQPGSTGHQHPGPSPSGGDGNGAGKGGGGRSPLPSHGGSGDPAAPAGGGSAPAPVPASSGNSGQQSAAVPPPVADEHAEPEKHPLPEAVEATGKAAGEAVEKTGDAAQGAVEGVGKTGDCLLRGCSK